MTSLIERLEFIRKHECKTDAEKKAITEAVEALKRNEPIAPNSTEDHTWGVRKIVPVCPTCDYHLTITYFLDGKPGVSYCETCGQAINWEGWEYD